MRNYIRSLHFLFIQTITHLNIRRNRINDEVIKHLAKILETNQVFFFKNISWIYI